MRLGDLDALKRAIEDRIDSIPSNDYDQGWNAAINTAIDEIDNAPTIKTFTLLDIEEQYRKGLKKGLSEWETERPHGKWSGIGGVWKCSNCNGHYPYKTKFCPNCGAQMNGGEAE